MRRRGSSRALLLVSLCASVVGGCGAREALDIGAGAGSSRQCPELEVTDVPECTRASPEALPLARLAELPGETGGMDGWHLAADEAHLYFVSESRIFRVSKEGGEPEPLTPPHTAGQSLTLVGDFLYWWHEGWVRRMPVGGGPIEPALELPEADGWTVAPDAILSWQGSEYGAPLRSTSLSTGEATVLWAGARQARIVGFRADESHAYGLVGHDLLRVPLEGGAAELLGEGTDALSGWAAGGGLEWIVTDTHVYLGRASFEDVPVNEAGSFDPKIEVYRVAKESPHTAEQVVNRGFSLRMVEHEDDLFLDAVVRANEGPETRGEIVRVPLDGGEVERIGESDSASPALSSVYTNTSAGIAASDCHVFVHLRCEDEDTYRLVALPYGEEREE